MQQDSVHPPVYFNYLSVRHLYAYSTINHARSLLKGEQQAVINFFKAIFLFWKS